MGNIFPTLKLELANATGIIQQASVFEQNENRRASDNTQSLSRNVITDKDGHI
jgi:hypothetical protein